MTAGQGLICRSLRPDFPLNPLSSEESGHQSIALTKTNPIVLQLLSVALVFGLLPQESLAVGDPVEGRKKAQVCLTCHRKGNVVLGKETPIISGQYRDYLIKALRDYKSGMRQHTLMNDLAAALSDQDIEDISAYYSGLNSRLTNPTQ